VVRVGYVGEKNCEIYGPGTPYYTLYKTLEQTKYATRSGEVFYDMPSSNHDSKVLELAGKSDVLVYSSIHPTRHRPAESTLQLVRYRYKVPVVGTLWDSNLPEDSPANNFTMKVSDMVIPMGPNKEHPGMTLIPEAYDIETYFNDHRERDIDISYLGSLVPRRLDFIRSLQNEGLDIFVSGDQRKSGLSQLEFTDLLRRSKITINFPLRNEDILDSQARKGRPIEAALCGTVVAEEKTNLPESVYYLRPDEEYIVLDKSDIKKSADIIREHLRDQDKLKRMSDTAYERVKEDCSPDTFWREVLRRLGKLDE